MKQLIALSLLITLLVPNFALADNLRGQFFAMADADQSAFLNKTEFRRYIQLLAESGNKGAGLVRGFGLYDAAWARVNTDGNSVISRDEVNTAGRTIDKPSVRAAVNKKS